MRTNLFIGVEGTHSLLSDVFDGEQFALPTCPMFKGPEARLGLQNGLGLDEIIASLFSNTSGKTECNIGITRTGAAGPLLAGILSKCPSETRVWFFKSVDSELTKSLFETEMQNSTAGAVERMTGKLKKDLNSEVCSTASATALNDINTAATDLSAGDWTYFNLSYYNGGAVPTTGSIMTRLFVKP
jgi:hypothetical protein